MSGVGRTRIAALAMLGVFVGAVGIEHVVERGFAPEQHMISEYAHTGTGAIMQVGFGAWCMSWVLLAVIFSLGHRRLAVVATGIAAVGVALVTGFHTQAVAGELPAGVARTLAGRLHDLGGELVLGGVLAAAVTTVFTSRSADARWLWGGMTLLGVALVTAGLLVVGDPVPGLRQRVLVAAAVGYQALVLRDVVPWNSREVTSDGSAATSRINERAKPVH